MRLLPYTIIALCLAICLPLQATSELKGHKMSIYCHGEEVAQQIRSYDSESRSLAIWDTTGFYWMFHNDDMLTTEIRYPNGIQSYFSYDELGQISLVEHCLGEEEAFLSYDDEYDDEGRQSAVTCFFCGDIERTTYSYTSEGYLSRVDYADGDFEAYTYDDWGQRLTKETQDTFIDYEYDGCLLTRAGDTYYTYDEYGYLKERISSYGTETFTFDGLYLTEVANEAGPLTFTYDEEGRRIKKSADRELEYLHLTPEVFGGIDRVRTPLMVGQSVEYFCYAETPLAILHPGGISYFLYDSPNFGIGAIVDPAMIRRLQYDAFGMPRDPSCCIGFQGECYDTETGLYYLRHRYYDPTIGRFISPDTLDDHPYVYCRNDPIQYVDPLGLWPWGSSGSSVDLMGKGYDGPFSKKGGGKNTPPPPPPPPPPSKPDPFGPNKKTHDIPRRPKPEPAPPQPKLNKKPAPQPAPPPQPPKEAYNPSPSQPTNPPPAPPPQQAPKPAVQPPLQPNPSSPSPEKLAIGDVGRNGVSLLAHGALGLIDDLILGPIATISRYDRTFERPHNDPDSPPPTYRDRLDRIHSRIDEALDTDQGWLYQGAAQQNRFPGSTLAMPPPPTLIGGGGAVAKTVEASAKAAATVVGAATAAKVAQLGTPSYPATAYEALMERQLEAERRAAERGLTKFSDVSGWKPGDLINNLSKNGKIPSWNAIRERYWKNEALYSPEKYSPKNLERMQKGKAPQRYNRETGMWESKELHHVPPQRQGGRLDFIDVWPDEHSTLDTFRFVGN